MTDSKHLARAARRYLDAAERYMLCQRLGRMRESVIDELSYAREQLRLELEEDDPK